MLALALAASLTPAHSDMAALERAMLRGRELARLAADPIAVLEGSNSLEDKLDAVDQIHARVPNQGVEQRKAGVLALVRAAENPKQPAPVRAKAIAHAGYAVPPLAHEPTQGAVIQAMLKALSDPVLRLGSLQGLGPASHGLPKELESAYLLTLLGLLEGGLAGDERVTALVALQGFVSPREDLSTRKLGLVEQLDARLLAPIEKDPAAFVRDPRNAPAARSLAVSIVWSSARHRERLRQPKPSQRVRVLLEQLLALETDPETRGWLESYRDAPPATPPAARPPRAGKPPRKPSKPPREPKDVFLRVS